MGNVQRKVLGRIGVILLGSFMVGCSSPSTPPGENTPANVSPSQPNLGLASSFAVLGGSAGITNQGVATVILGDIGTTGSSTMITGFHNSAFSYTETPLNMGAVTGSVYTAGPPTNEAALGIATSALADAQAAYTALSNLSGGVDPGASQLGGKTLSGGVYKSNSGAFLLTGGDLTLDGKDNPNSVWVFQMAGSLTVGSPTASQSVLLINGAQAKNVFWQVGSAATINPAGGGTMVGTIISNAGADFSTAGNTAVTTLNGRMLSLVASVTLVNTSINPYDVVVEGAVLPEQYRSHITLSGSTSGNVTTTITDGGYINVQNDGAYVTATVHDVGTMNIVNSGAGVTATLTGTGSVSIVNSGTAALTATNTGNGKMTIHNDASAALTVTQTGNGNVTVNFTGSTPMTYTFSDNEDHVIGDTLVLAAIQANITISGTNEAPNHDVAAVLTGSGFISVVNNGAHVAATETGSGSISIVNNGVGGVMTATNTGNGAMTITSDATAAVTVTNTGNGRVTVYATGDSAITIVHNGDGDYTYGSPQTALSLAEKIKIMGTHALDVSPTLTGYGSIKVVNNGAHVAATETGNGSLKIVNDGLVLTATNTGNGHMVIRSNATGAVTVTNTGDADVTVNATGSEAITLVYSGAGPFVYPAVGDPGYVALAAIPAVQLVLGGSNAGAISPTLNGSGYINVINNSSGGVTPTLTGDGSIHILNNSTSAGAVTATLTGDGPMSLVNTGAGLTVSNTGNGAVNVYNSAMGAVTVTNTGNGKVTVYASGLLPITVTHVGDDDYTYGSPFDVAALSSLASHTVVTGAYPLMVVTTLNPTFFGAGFIYVYNDSDAAVTVTQGGTGTTNIVNVGIGGVLTTTNNGNGLLSVNNSATAAVTVTHNGSGHVTVNTTGSTAITVTSPNDALDHVYTTSFP